MITDVFDYHHVHFDHSRQVWDRVRMPSDLDFCGEEMLEFQSNLGTDHSSRLALIYSGGFPL